MARRHPNFIALLVLSLVGAIVPLVVHAPVADAQAPAVVINEFQALNDTTIADNTGAFSDWIELKNTGGSAVDLTGWSLADSANSFTFTAGPTIQPDDLLLIFASGDVTRTTPVEIHLPFKLSGAGEPLTLSDPVGTLSTPHWDSPASYPAQLADFSYGLDSGGGLVYFPSPTPGSTNTGGVSGVVAPVTFSVDHGFYTSTQTVVLDTATPSSTIIYTTDGSVPGSGNGTPIAPGASITVSATTTLRAVAERPQWITSPVETRSYLFTADILQQTGTPPGFPSGPVNGQQFDYGMDPDVVNGNELLVASSLTSIPTISVVTDLDNLFDPTIGIYVNPHDRGRLWERQASIELIDPSGAEPGFDIEAGIRIRGGWSRHLNNPKHSLRLFFRDDYESELNYPLFQSEGTDGYAKVDLRTSQNYSWSWQDTNNATFIDEVWSRDTQRDMGHPYTRTRPYHVYLNGTYWGLYMTQERVSGEFGESYLGGAENDFDVVKRGAPASTVEASDGTLDAFQSLFPLVSDLDVTAAEYATIESQVDLVNLADYYLLHFFSGDFDGSPSWFFNSGGNRWNRSNNYYAVRNRNGVGVAGKWQFFDHDSEHSLCANGGPSDGVNMDNTPPWNLQLFATQDYMSPAWLHEALISHPAYRQLFIDRVQLHMLTPGGALTNAANHARFEARVTEFSAAIDGESARWGDTEVSSPYDRTDWEYGLNLKRTCLDDRPAVVESQLRADGLWPLTDPPTISPVAGPVPYGTPVTIDDGGQSGTIWYTTDGSDPRNTDGSPAPSAQSYSASFPVVGDMTVKARVRTTPGQWTPVADATFTLSSPPGPVTLALNEYNAVGAGNYLGGGTAGDIANGTDATFGRVQNNGGDWFELVVTQDHLDIRGWTIEIWNIDLGLDTLSASLTFTNDALFGDLRSGTLVTVSEDIADDVSYDPITGDWHINVQSNNVLAGSYITTGTQTNFGINNDDTQIAIFDATGAPVQLRTGEGTAPGISVNSTEVFKLEGEPTTAVTPDSPLYADGTSSTWGLPNVWAGGTQAQTLEDLRIDFGDVNCDGNVNVADALIIAQYVVGTRTAAAACPLASPGTEIFAAAADVSGNGSTDVGDALLVAQCTVGLTNRFCP